jgi:thiol-disulfide isomerase/thioredoxin
MDKKWIYPLGLIVVGFLAFYLYQKYKIAPDLKLNELHLIDLNDRPADLSIYKGKKLLLCFAASWCEPCRKELEMLSTIKDDQLGEVQIVVISDEEVDVLSGFKSEITYPFIWLRLKEPLSSVGINSIPASYFVNKKGVVVKKEVGYIDWKDPSTARYLSKLMD